MRYIRHPYTKAKQSEMYLCAKGKEVRRPETENHMIT